MQQELKNEYRRRHKDMFAQSGMPSVLTGRQASGESWRELVSLGATFGLGLAGLAALVMVLTQ